MLRALGFLTVLALVLAIGAGAGGLYIFYRFGSELPDYQQLADYEPPTVTRVHAGDGRLLAEFAREKRMFVPVSAMPRRVVDAFLAAEDKNFYTHYGIDPLAVARAFVVYARIKLLGERRRPEGGSTITQQVAKNFLLTNEVSFERKIKEAILVSNIKN